MTLHVLENDSPGEWFSVNECDGRMALSVLENGSLGDWFSVSVMAIEWH